MPSSHRSRTSPGSAPELLILPLVLPVPQRSEVSPYLSTEIEIT